MHNRKIAHFQGQIETALKKFREELDLRMKDLFAKLRIKSHLTAAGIRKCEGYSPLQLLFVLTNVVFLHIATVHDLLSRPLKSFSQAHKDTFYRFKKAEWSWGTFYRRVILFLGRRLRWSRSAAANCLILDTTILPKRGRCLENLTWVYDHCRGKSVSGYELLVLAILTPGNLFPLDFGFHFSKHALAEARQSQPRRPRGYLARHLKAARRTKIELSLQRLTQALSQGIKATWLLVDAWFTSPKFCAAVRELGLHVIGRLKADGTLYTHAGQAYNLRQLYRACRHLLTPVPELGLAALRVPVSCSNGLSGAIVLTRGYQEPDLDTKPGGKIKAPSPWTGFFTTDLSLTAPEAVQKYQGRWSIGVSSKGRIIQSVKVRPRLTDSRPRSWEGAVARKQDGKALRQPSSKGGGATLQVVTCSERRRSLVTRIPVAETVDNVRRQQEMTGMSRIRFLSPAGYQRRHGAKDYAATGEALGARRRNLDAGFLPITVGGKWREWHQGGGSGRSTGDPCAAKRTGREGPGPVDIPFWQSEAGVR